MKPLLVWVTIPFALANICLARVVWFVGFYSMARALNSTNQRWIRWAKRGF